MLALDTVGERERALRLLRDMQHLRADDGGYWTGYVFADEVVWPAQQTTYTAAAVVIAADGLAGTSPTSHLFVDHDRLPELLDLGDEALDRD